MALSQMSPDGKRARPRRDTLETPANKTERCLPTDAPIIRSKSSAETGIYGSFVFARDIRFARCFVMTIGRWNDCIHQTARVWWRQRVARLLRRRRRRRRRKDLSEKHLRSSSSGSSCEEDAAEEPPARNEAMRSTSKLPKVRLGLVGRLDPRLSIPKETAAMAGSAVTRPVGQSAHQVPVG